LEAFHGEKSPLYRQITRQSFQTVVNDLFGSPSTAERFQHRPDVGVEVSEFISDGGGEKPSPVGKKAQSDFLRDHHACLE